MPNTTLGFPYPSNSDDVDVAGDIGALATAVDTYVGNIHGTAIKSTGATNGQALVANGSGGATFAAIQSTGGNYNAPTSATATFNQPTTAVSSTAVTIQGGANVGYANIMNVGGNGTIIASYAKAHTTYNGWSANLYYFDNVGGTISSASLSQSSSGTSRMAGFGYGFDSAGTGFILVEKTQTLSTQVQAWVKKYSGTAATNSWSTQLAVNLQSGQGIYNGNEGPFYDNTVHYAPELGAWIGGDYRASTTAWNGTASIWLINDATGTATSVVFGTSASGSVTRSAHLFFIPASSGSSGTIHHWGQMNGTYFYSQYAATGTSLSEVMANNGTAVFAGVSVTPNDSNCVPTYTYWNQTLGEGWGNWSGTFIRFNRSGSALSTVVTTHGSVTNFGQGSYQKGKERSNYIPEKGILISQTGGAYVLLAGTAGTALNTFLQPDAPAWTISHYGNTGAGIAVCGTGNTYLHAYDISPNANNTAARIQMQTVKGIAYATALGTSAVAEARFHSITSTTNGTPYIYQAPNTLNFGGTSIRLVPGTVSAVVSIFANTLSTAAATAVLTSYSIDLS